VLLIVAFMAQDTVRGTGGMDRDNRCFVADLLYTVDDKAFAYGERTAKFISVARKAELRTYSSSGF
jgi:hypothetical protein